MGDKMVCLRCGGNLTEGITNVGVKKGGTFSIGFPKAVGAVICEQCGYVELYYGTYWYVNRSLPENIREKIKQKTM
jgi:predicted nucleic-acid-binding Zn-ribbon protein